MSYDSCYLLAPGIYHLLRSWLGKSRDLGRNIKIGYAISRTKLEQITLNMKSQNLIIHHYFQRIPASIYKIYWKYKVVFFFSLISCSRDKIRLNIEETMVKISLSIQHTYSNVYQSRTQHLVLR